MALYKQGRPKIGSSNRTPLAVAWKPEAGWGKCARWAWRWQAVERYRPIKSIPGGRLVGALSPLSSPECDAGRDVLSVFKLANPSPSSATSAQVTRQLCWAGRWVLGYVRQVGRKVSSSPARSLECHAHAIHFECISRRVAECRVQSAATIMHRQPAAAES